MNNQQKTVVGYIAAASAMGMMLMLLAGDISNLKSWSEATYPAFVAGMMTHIASVLLAYAGGKLVPDNRDNQMTRSSDVTQLPKTP